MAQKWFPKAVELYEVCDAEFSPGEVIPASKLIKMAKSITPVEKWQRRMLMTFESNNVIRNNHDRTFIWKPNGNSDIPPAHMLSGGGASPHSGEATSRKGTAKVGLSVRECELLAPFLSERERNAALKIFAFLREHRVAYNKQMVSFFEIGLSQGKRALRQLLRAGAIEQTIEGESSGGRKPVFYALSAELLDNHFLLNTLDNLAPEWLGKEKMDEIRNHGQEMAVDEKQKEEPDVEKVNEALRITRLAYRRGDPDYEEQLKKNAKGAEVSVERLRRMVESNC